MTPSYLYLIEDPHLRRLNQRRRFFLRAMRCPYPRASCFPLSGSGRRRRITLAMLAHTYLVAAQPQNFTGVVNSSINGLAVSASHKVTRVK